MKPFDFNPSSTKPILHLAHANGFLPPTYREAFEPLLAHYHVISFPLRPLWGDTPPEWLTSWSQMAGDLVDSLKGTGAKGVVGVGHSLGGVLTLYAAVQQPDLFSRVILIDPTMLSPLLLWRIKLHQLFGLEARSFLIKGALRRKRDWENPEAAYEYFRGRKLFKNWSDEMVRTYTQSITGPAPGGRAQLTYPPEWEAQIYRTIPTDVWKFAKQLQQTTLVIRGENSNTFLADGEKAFKKLNPKADLKVVRAAGHLVPQEKPEEVGRLMMTFLGPQT